MQAKRDVSGRKYTYENVLSDFSSIFENTIILG